MTTNAHYRRRPLRERAWWVMREMAVFCLDDLLLTVADGTERGAADNLRRYIRQLTHYGVLAHACQARDDRNYRLAKDLGPRAPVYRARRKQLIDTNTAQPIPKPIDATPGGQP